MGQFHTRYCDYSTLIVCFVDFRQKMRSVIYSGAVMAAILASAGAEDEMPMIQNAMELLARASSTSEVLTLNLTNLLILLVSKLSSLVSAFSLSVAPVDQPTLPWSPRQTLQEACASSCSPQEPRKSLIASSVPPARTPTWPLTT